MSRWQEIMDQKVGSEGEREVEAEVRSKRVKRGMRGDGWVS
jgi:hypothetical protein